MPAVIIFLFLVTEFLISGWFASSLGVGVLFLEIIGTGIVGLILISSMNYHLNDALNSVRKGEIHPQELLSSAVSRVFGGILILIPGVFTDTIGLFLILNSKLKSRRPTKTDETNENIYTQNPKEGDVIDVEIVEEDKNEKIDNRN